MRRSRLAVALAVSLSALLPSCVPRTSFNLGVMPTVFGSVRFLFVHCEDLGVTDVSLAVARPRQGATPPLWRIHAEAPSPDSVFTVGRTPLGFREEVRLRRALPPRRQLFALVETSVGSYAMGFRALDLVPGLVRRPADMVTQQAFAEGACD
jgi:hypothetical protein